MAVVVERPSSPCPALTRNVGVEVVADTQVPPVVADMSAAESGTASPSCLHSSLIRSAANSSALALAMVLASADGSPGNIC